MKQSDGVFGFTPQGIRKASAGELAPFAFLTGRERWVNAECIVSSGELGKSSVAHLAWMEGS